MNISNYVSNSMIATAGLATVGAVVCCSKAKQVLTSFVTTRMNSYNEGKEAQAKFQETTIVRASQVIGYVVSIAMGLLAFSFIGRSVCQFVAQKDLIDEYKILERVYKMSIEFYKQRVDVLKKTIIELKNS